MTRRPSNDSAIAGSVGQSLLRFVTAGSVDDGKSTLIGRLLYDARALMRDQIAALQRAGDELDLAALTDGLESEREQGITIDVAYRYFATPRRSFVIADAPGHEQYTRNMVTAASTADIAVILVDASRAAGGQLRTQTRRHAAIARMMGLGVIVAVNKMDAVGWSQDAFGAIDAALTRLFRALDIAPLAVVPISAKHGDNVAVTSANAPWYGGPSLLECLENAPAILGAPFTAFRFPVQRVARFAVPGVETGRGYQGRIESGHVELGQIVRVAPSGHEARVAAIHTFDGLLAAADAGRSVTLFLDREIDVARGDTLTEPAAPLARDLIADLCWLDDTPWAPERKYLVRQGTRTTSGRIEEVLFVRDISDLAAASGANALALNDIASVRVRTQSPLLADAYAASPATGGFVLIDPVTNRTAAAGLIRAAA